MSCKAQRSVLPHAVLPPDTHCQHSMLPSETAPHQQGSPGAASAKGAAGSPRGLTRRAGRPRSPGSGDQWGSPGHREPGDEASRTCEHAAPRGEGFPKRPGPLGMRLSRLQGPGMGPPGPAGMWMWFLRTIGFVGWGSLGRVGPG